jgi:hypothetical protein
MLRRYGVKGAVLDQVTGILAGEDIVWSNYETAVALQTTLELDLQDVYRAGRQCHGNLDSSAVGRRLASSDETDIV